MKKPFGLTLLIILLGIASYLCIQYLTLSKLDREGRIGNIRLGEVYFTRGEFLKEDYGEEWYISDKDGLRINGIIIDSIKYGYIKCKLSNINVYSARDNQQMFVKYFTDLYGEPSKVSSCPAIYVWLGEKVTLRINPYGVFMSNVKFSFKPIAFSTNSTNHSFSNQIFEKH